MGWPLAAEVLADARHGVGVSGELLGGRSCIGECPKRAQAFSIGDGRLAHGCEVSLRSCKGVWIHSKKWVLPDLVPLKSSSRHEAKTSEVMENFRYIPCCLPELAYPSAERTPPEAPNFIPCCKAESQSSNHHAPSPTRSPVSSAYHSFFTSSTKLKHTFRP